MGPEYNVITLLTFAFGPEYNVKKRNVFFQMFVIGKWRNYFFPRGVYVGFSQHSDTTFLS